MVSKIPFTFAVVFACSSSAAFSETVHDLVIYGGTSAGIAAAIQAKKMGGSVVLIEPTQRIGGLTTGGLGQTDIGHKKVVGGISRDFYREIKKWYSRQESWTAMPKPEGHFKGDGQSVTHAEEDTQWSFEPSTALAIYQRWVKDQGIELVLGERLDRAGEGKAVDRGDGYWVAKPGSVSRGVVKEGNRIVSITTESGRTFSGKAFMDATYEGDLMAAAGVSFTIGREGKVVFGENFNGVQTDSAFQHHKLEDGIDPYVKPGEPSSGLLYGIDPEGPGVTHGSDHKIQAYCFRMCLTNHDPNRILFAKPEGYREDWYELLFRNYEKGFNSVPWINSTMPNKKTDTNNRTGVSTNFIGQNYDWPQGSHEERVKIREKQLLYQKGLMWTLANHPRVPENVREIVSQWGMTKDEFIEGDGWQEQLYVREGRRMISDVVMTEAHCLHTKEVEDSVGMGSYPMDSHNTQRYITKSGHVQNEGDTSIRRIKPYGISYHSIIPTEKECANLTVPIAMASSHIAFGSIRMEPVFMILGQSGATATMLSLKQGIPLQKLNYKVLRERLLADGQVLENKPSGTTPKGILTDDAQAKLEGAWVRSLLAEGVGTGYHHDQAGKQGPATATFALSVPKAGNYTLQIATLPHGNRSSKTLVKANGAEFRIDQRKAEKTDGYWNFVSDLTLEAGAFTVTISNEGADGHVIADAVRLLSK
jgi:methionine-rich copper-binding protein CopC